nr:hypothetical protein [Eubacterium sp.]
MNAVEVVLLLIGFVSISVSFFLGNKKNPSLSDEGVEVGMKEVWTEKEEELVKERIQTILNDETEEIMARTTETLNRKSNEKIMEFDEFSGQVLEKIRHNHEEVVFMYSMLTEKQKDIKEDVVKSVITKKVTEKQEVKEKKTIASEKKKQTNTTQTTALEKRVSKPEEKKESGGAQNQIIRMHKSGKSVLEISKELNIGQGEVKLMIALYGGKA